jgi:bifunctional non-homologous end joining protein LigD
MPLEEYARKRSFDKTPEPAPGKAKPRTGHTGMFCVQRHNASHLHYDFRLEIDGTLKSWAVPKGPSLDPTVKHFAAMVEDHPIAYGDFEGNIPKGNYGGGSVMLWDRGTFELIGEESGEAQIVRGDLKFALHGEKLAGTWALVRMKGKGKGNEWLLIKKKDGAAQPGWDVETQAWSVKTGRTQEEIAADLPPKRQSTKQKSSPLPDFFAPMAAQLTDKLPAGSGWIFEVKWDGVRGLCFVDEGKVDIYTRNGNRCERQYPELQVLPNFIDALQAILDGEIVILDAKGAARFELIQPRIHVQDAQAIAQLAKKNPARLYLFDLLWLDGKDLRGKPLAERRKLLAKIVRPHPLIKVSESFEGNGEELLEAARSAGLEGMMAKRAESKYESRRSSNWLKVKLTNEQEFVIGGVTPGERDTFGSLALGYYDDHHKLNYVGNVGTGFTERTLKEVWKRLEPLGTKTRPFAKADGIPKDTIWVRPELVAQIKFANWTGDNRLRAPVFLGLRNDKPAKEVEKELPVSARVKFTNLDKVYFPDEGYTKGDLIHYYSAVADLILPYLHDRPLSLKRYPNGIKSDYFFQKNTPDSYPDWLETVQIEKTRFVMAQNKDALLYLTNLGCIDQNPWMSRVGSLDRPDYILMDIDPYQCEFEKVIQATLLVKEKLDAIGLKGYPKTTGGDGMHVYVPIEPVYTYDQARGFAEVIGRTLAAENPKLFTLPRSVEKREKDRVYFDWMQIGESKTISAPYSVRAHAGAPVSTPLKWEEVTPKLRPEHFTMKTAPTRFKKVGDLFAGVLEKKQRLEKAFAKLEKLVKR